MTANDQPLGSLNPRWLRFVLNLKILDDGHFVLYLKILDGGHFVLTLNRCLYYSHYNILLNDFLWSVLCVLYVYYIASKQLLCCGLRTHSLITSAVCEYVSGHIRSCGAYSPPIHLALNHFIFVRWVTRRFVRWRHTPLAAATTTHKHLTTLGSKHKCYTQHPACVQDYNIVYWILFVWLIWERENKHSVLSVLLDTLLITVLLN